MTINDLFAMTKKYGLSGSFNEKEDLVAAILEYKKKRK